MTMEMSGAGGPKPIDPKMAKKLEEVPSSRAGAFLKNLIQKGIDFSQFTEGEAKEALAKTRFMPGVTAADVMGELRKMKILLPDSARTKAVPPPPPEHIETTKVELAGLTQVDDAEIIRQFEENKKYYDQLASVIYIDEKELDAIHSRSLSLASEGKESRIETPEYYYAFAEAGLKGINKKDVEKDVARLSERQKLFKERTAGKETKGKKIATIVEQAVAYSVTDLGWYGDKVSIEPASQYDDIFGGIDDVLEIKRDDDSSKFLALGIDVTYSGIFSERYKEKVFKLLHSIKEGQHKKLKYFKNHKGEMMPEFSVPKTILAFDVDAVKDLLNFIKNIDNEEEREKFKNHPMKLNVLNQMMIQCELLLNFAEDCGNDISTQYNEVVTSINLLSRKNPAIKEALGKREQDEISKRFTSLIQEFKDAYVEHPLRHAA